MLCVSTGVYKINYVLNLLSPPQARTCIKFEWKFIQKRSTNSCSNNHSSCGTWKACSGGHAASRIIKVGNSLVIAWTVPTYQVIKEKDSGKAHTCLLLVWFGMGSDSPLVAILYPIGVSRHYYSQWGANSWRGDTSILKGFSHSHDTYEDTTRVQYTRAAHHPPTKGKWIEHHSGRRQNRNYGIAWE